MSRLVTLFAAVMVLAAAPAFANSHANLTWTGYDMCLSCHTTQAQDMHASVHYQWLGNAPFNVNGPNPQGKLTNEVNSYCVNIMGNWNGCGACHIGVGAKPTSSATTAQLANIDCLMCHQKEYKRVRNATTGLFQPDTANMTITMNQAVQTVHKPVRQNCLQCHARAGGGDAVKRSLALAHGTTGDANFDVHMATTRGNLSCQSCHTFTRHKVSGKGSDLRVTDSSVPLDCTKCHANKATASGHTTAAVNKHVARVACQTCHIPRYGKNASDTAANEATETFRTWKYSTGTAAPYHPAGTRANNLIPAYRFWNKYANNYLLYDVAVLDPATGAYPTTRVLGTINDSSTATKLYPFKYKTAEQPMRSGSKQLIAIDTSVFFANPVPGPAIQQGLVNMGFSANDPWEWVITDTFQSLNHQVSPKSAALACSTCHANTSQMNLKGQLGYHLKGAQSTICSQCHRAKTPKDYISIHSRHVDSKKYDCSWCHIFSRPERSLIMPK